MHMIVFLYMAKLRALLQDSYAHWPTSQGTGLERAGGQRNCGKTQLRLSSINLWLNLKKLIRNDSSDLFIGWSIELNWIDFIYVQGQEGVSNFNNGV